MELPVRSRRAAPATGRLITRPSALIQPESQRERARGSSRFDDQAGDQDDKFESPSAGVRVPASELRAETGGSGQCGRPRNRERRRNLQ